jgi:hypothetical protein
MEASHTSFGAFVANDEGRAQIILGIYIKIKTV